MIVLKSLLEMLHSKFDRNRVILGSVYDRDFPTPEKTAAEEAKNLANKPAGGGVKLGQASQDRSRDRLPRVDNHRREVFRRGEVSRHHQRRSVGKTEKRNGKIKEVEIEVLCEADRSYIAAAREEEE